MNRKVLWDTLKLQPIVMLYSLVSISSKLASGHFPSWNSNIFEYIKACFRDIWLPIILLTMMVILFVYAIVWQKCIKNVPITVMYANKSSYIFWAQIAAVIIFNEKLSMCNIIGIMIIFLGILVVNGNE